MEGRTEDHAEYKDRSCSPEYVRTQEKRKLEAMKEDVPLAFRLVTAATAASSSLTIGEDNKKKNMWRGGAWMVLVFMPAMFVAGSAVSAYVMYYNSSSSPWVVPVVMLIRCRRTSSALVLLFDHCARWMLIIWCCFAAVLIAAVLAFWICLVRMYDDPGSSSWGGLAIGLALSSLVAAAFLAALIHLVSFRDLAS